MAKYIATYSDTLGDIEITGFSVMTDKEVESFEELATSVSWSFIYKIGEEELEYSSGEDLLTRIDFREISNEEFKILKKVFNADFGTFIGEDYLEQIIGEEEGENRFDNDDEDVGFNSKDDDDDDY
jgi:hypothetical protein